MEKEKKMAEDKTMGKHLAARRKTSHHKRQFPSPRPPKKKSTTKGRSNAAEEIEEF